MSCAFINKSRYFHSDSSEAEADLAGRCHSGPRGAACGHSGPGRLSVTAPSSRYRFSKSATNQRRDGREPRSTRSKHRTLTSRCCSHWKLLVRTLVTRRIAKLTAKGAPSCEGTRDATTRKNVVKLLFFSRLYPRAGFKPRFRLEKEPTFAQVWRLRWVFFVTELSSIRRLRSCFYFSFEISWWCWSEVVADQPLPPNVPDHKLARLA